MSLINWRSRCEWLAVLINEDKALISDCQKSFVRGDKTVQLVELKNMVITLDENKSERYLQLKSGIATGDDDEIKV